MSTAEQPQSQLGISRGEFVAFVAAIMAVNALGVDLMLPALPDTWVVIRHLYTERRLQPLDLYLRHAAPEAAREAVIDYGQVLRDLAATNIFPGDMLLKNFGVSRHGRLIFYDYDELAPLSECRFRELPHSSDDGE